MVTSNQPGKAVVAETVKASAVVTAIDKATRKVTLKTAKGKSFEVVVGEEVKNSTRSRAGCWWNWYVQALTMQVIRRRPRSSTQTWTAAQAMPGERPASGRRPEVTAADGGEPCCHDDHGGALERQHHRPDGRASRPTSRRGRRGRPDPGGVVEALAIAIEPAAKKPAAKRKRRAAAAGPLPETGC